ncbi:MAG: MBOAT family protein [Sedimentisphaerales bacterium]|nr:MBOAT family protein [Sedimentisphaerales bacterium]
MLFQTWVFLLFFLVVYLIYLLLKRTRVGVLWLLISSYFFYGWANPLYVILILYATTFDFIISAQMEKSPRRKLWLTVSIVNSLAILSFFKYFGFVTDNLNTLFAYVNFPYRIMSPGLLLPFGLSFYLFQSIGYMIDCYRGDIERENSFVRYAVFIAFFPRLLMGPIERAGNFLPQLRNLPSITKRDVGDGLSLFVVGLFKKIAIADYLALYVDKIYSNPGDFQSPALLLATFLFCWQIYFDFSGYTDMARGIARMLGFRLMLNFKNPYLATSLGDFWNRWHISLSSWFKDYLYIPLGGNRKGKFNTYKNIFITMVLSGLWHGAAWTFIIWGAVHAIGRFATRELERTDFYKKQVPKIFKQALVFTLVSFAWIFFRASNISDAWLIISKIFTSGLANPYCPLLAILMILAIWIYQFMYESSFRKILEIKYVNVIMTIMMIMYLLTFSSSRESYFIYLIF